MSFIKTGVDPAITFQCLEWPLTPPATADNKKDLIDKHSNPPSQSEFIKNSKAIFCFSAFEGKKKVQHKYITSRGQNLYTNNSINFYIIVTTLVVFNMCL